MVQLGNECVMYISLLAMVYYYANCSFYGGKIGAQGVSGVTIVYNVAKAYFSFMSNGARFWRSLWENDAFTGPALCSW